MFLTFDKKEFLVQEHHHPYPPFSSPHDWLEGLSSYMVLFETVFCQSHVQRRGGQAEATNLDLLLDVELGNTMGRMILT